MRNRHERRRLVVVATVILTVLVMWSSGETIPSVKAAYTGVPKPMEFYFHFVNTPVAVAGQQAKYIMNSTRQFSFLTQQEAYANSLYKPEDQPKIVVDFYLYPNLAGPVTVNGTWQVFVWLNSSAYKPATFTLTFKEITAGGVELWDSGLLNPTVTSSIGSYIDVPVYNYNLSVPLVHSFTPGTTLLVEVELNAGASADIRFWYDSQLYPSKVILPAEDYARPTSIKTYSVDDSETTLFHHNWSESWRKVIVRANVTDPYGGYDVYKVTMTITDPLGDPVLEEAEMSRVSDGQWHLSYQQLFEANWSYPLTAALGNYTVIVRAIDNNGYYNKLSSGTFEPFIEEETHIFTIGVVVYYDPTIIITDDAGDPLPEAQVYITWANGTTDTLPRYTSTDGTINLTHVLAGTYGFRVIWKDVIVAQAKVLVNSDGPYTIKANVYQLTVQVLGNNGMPIHGAYVIVNTESGAGYGLDTTAETGKALFQLPSGTYRVTAHYTSDYWLTVVRASATREFPVTASTSENIVLTNFPPAIWSTTLFGLLIALVIGATAAVFLTLYTRRRA